MLNLLFFFFFSTLIYSNAIVSMFGNLCPKVLCFLISGSSWGPDLENFSSGKDPLLLPLFGMPHPGTLHSFKAVVQRGSLRISFPASLIFQCWKIQCVHISTITGSPCSSLMLVGTSQIFCFDSLLFQFSVSLPSSLSWLI